MKQLYIIGAGAFGREAAWVAERMNEVCPTWDLRGFIDDDPAVWGHVEGGYPVLGGMELLLNSTQLVYAVCAVGTAAVRRKIMSRLTGRPNVDFATLIDPSVIQGARSKIGKGSILCAGTILAVDSVIGDHVIVNFDCTVGHDTILHDYTTVNPGVNLSGYVEVGECSELGTGSSVIQGKRICADTIVGAGGVVIRDITESGTYVGVPVQKKTSRGG